MGSKFHLLLSLGANLGHLIFLFLVEELFMRRFFWDKWDRNFPFSVFNWGGILENFWRFKTLSFLVDNFL